MKKKFMIFVSLAFLIIAFFSIYICCFNKHNKTDGSTKQLTRKEKLEDFDYAYDILKNNFPYFPLESKKTNFDWLAHKKEYEKQVKNTKNDIEFYNAMTNIFYSVQNAHTHIIPPSYLEDYKKNEGNYTWLNVLDNSKVKARNNYWKKELNKDNGNYVVPLCFLYVEGKYVVVNNQDIGKPNNAGIDYSYLEGNILDKINSIPVDDYVKGMMNKTYLEYDSSRNKLKLNPLFLTSRSNEEWNLSFKTAKGETVDKKISSIKFSETNDNQGQSKSNNTENCIISSNKVAYMRVDSMNMDTKDSDFLEISKFYDKIKGYPYLIIDIRGNGGGGDTYWQDNIVAPLLEKSLSATGRLLFSKGDYVQPFIDSTTRE